MFWGPLKLAVLLALVRDFVWKSDWNGHEISCVACIVGRLYVTDTRAWSSLCFLVDCCHQWGSDKDEDGCASHCGLALVGMRELL